MNNLKYEKKYQNEIIIGIDEVGRGPLAGPVVIAGVILENYNLIEITDSKKLSKLKIKKLAYEIINNATYIQIEEVSASEIDEKGIKNVVKEKMKKILDESPATCGLIDYEKIESNKIVESITKGDFNSMSIGAASIIAKFYRDQLMKNIGKKYPNYHFEQHVGYGTKKHIEAIEKFGPILGIHRFSYKPLRK